MKVALHRSKMYDWLVLPFTSILIRVSRRERTMLVASLSSRLVQLCTLREGVNFLNCKLILCVLFFLYKVVLYWYNRWNLLLKINIAYYYFIYDTWSYFRKVEYRSCVLFSMLSRNKSHKVNKLRQKHGCVILFVLKFTIAVMNKYDS